MNFSAPFIMRPVATLLLGVGLMIVGGVAYCFLPVAPLPSVDIPTIVVFANRPGADPETMASSVAAPLERRLGEISGVTELTSVNAEGNSNIIIQFDIARSIEDAAHDVEAALNAAVADLPSELPTAPYYRKFNPADAPIMILALTSGTQDLAQMYDAADTILGQRLSQVEGVGQVQINGAEKPAVRVQLDPAALQSAHLAAQDIVNILRAANVTQPTGGLQNASVASTLSVNGQISDASSYARLVVKTGTNATVRLGDVAKVTDSVANVRLAAWSGHSPAILLNISKMAGANVIETSDRIKAALPQLLSWLPSGIDVRVLSDRTNTIRASVQDVQLTLLMSVVLVLLVVLLFLRRMVPTLAALATVPLSIAGTLGAMWALGYTLDNFSLMALTIAVGFVVDDAIVMIENIIRHQEMGEAPLPAALNGARQIGFTVISISLSLVAVFIPILFMGGMLGKLLHEFAMTLTVAIAVSVVVSLTLTPMICGRFMRISHSAPSNTRLQRLNALLERGFQACTHGYERSLNRALNWPRMVSLVVVASIILTVFLYRQVPKGFLPIEDTGMLMGMTIAAPDISFQAMSDRQRRVVSILLDDPAVAEVGSMVGVGNGFNSLNRGQVNIQLKPLSERHINAEAVIARLRPRLAKVDGLQTFLQSAQDLRGGGRSGGGQFQFVLLSQDLTGLRSWTQKMEDQLKRTPGIEDVSSDQDKASPQINLVVDRPTASRLGVSMNDIDTALNNAYSQRQVSTIYTQRNQYRVIVEAAASLQSDPSMLDKIYVPGSGNAQIPLLSLVHLEVGHASLSIHHQGQFPASMLSFNLATGMALGDAEKAVQSAALALRMPPDVRFEFAGNAKFMQDSLKSQPLLIAAALLTIYIVLGVLYESLIHPLTIISTLPSAGLGALLVIELSGTEMSIMSIIGIVLLMGIVKKNGIMLIDFALEAEREQGLSPREAIHSACVTRLRPIIMTTLAALLGALPLAFAFGTGAEYRRPLGLAIAGGLVVSQILTLYTTPAIYLVLERWANRGNHGRSALQAIPDRS